MHHHLSMKVMCSTTESLQTSVEWAALNKLTTACIKLREVLR